MPDSQTSSRTQAKFLASTAFKQSSPDSTASARKPSSSKTPRKVSRMPRSSSTIKTELDILKKQIYFLTVIITETIREVICLIKLPNRYSKTNISKPDTKWRGLKIVHSAIKYISQTPCEMANKIFDFEYNKR